MNTRYSSYFFPMEAILQNPYRLSGVLAGASAREVQAQKGKINAFAKVGKSIALETDFPVLGPLDRNPETLQKAYSQIEQHAGKLAHSLFWFADGHPLDRVAMNYLKEGDLAKAAEIWSKPLGGGNLGYGNIFAYHNLGTLRLAQAFLGDQVDLDRYAEGIRYKAMLIDSDMFPNFLAKVTDEHYRVDIQVAMERFLASALEDVRSATGSPFAAGPMLEKLAGLPENALAYLRKEFVQGPVHRIERAIEKAKSTRKGNTDLALKAGGALLNDVKADCQVLDQLMPGNDLQYQMLSDSLSREVLQCGVDYWHEYHEQEEEGEYRWEQKVLTLTKKAVHLAKGREAKARAKENLSALEEWIADKPEREKQKEVAGPIAVVLAHLQATDEADPLVANARKLVESCRPELLTIKAALGGRNENYLHISSAVASRALDMMVGHINHLQEAFIQASKHRIWGPETEINDLKEGLKSAWRTTLIIEDMDMVEGLRSRYRENKNALQRIMDQLDVSTYVPSAKLTVSSRPTPPPSVPTPQAMPNVVRGEAESTSYSGIFPRINRKAYIIALIISFIGSIVIGLMVDEKNSETITMVIWAVLLFYFSVRRLHDLGMSAWYVLVALIPFGALGILYLIIEGGEEGPNQYGPVP